MANACRNSRSLYSPACVAKWLRGLGSSVLFSVLLCALPCVLHAANHWQQSQSQNQNQSQRLREQSQQIIKQQQQDIIDAATPDAAKPEEDADSDADSSADKAKADSRSKTQSTSQNISQNISAEAAIFMAINQRNWELLRAVAAVYEQQPNADPDLLLFVRAAQHSHRGEVAAALRKYQSLLAHKPNFVRARLDLAQLYYQDGLYRQSEAEFERILKMPRLPEAVHNNIQAYLTAIDGRQSFNATFSLGAGFERNINESSESETCMLALPNGDCAYLRTTPEAQHSGGARYEATLNRNWQMSGHHGATFSLLGYGTAYGSGAARDFNNTTVNLSAGYRFHDYSTELSVSPLIEYRHENERKLYTALGARLSYSKNLSQSALGSWLQRPLRMSLDVEYKDFRYRADYANNNGGQLTLYNNWFVTTSVPAQWFVSLDYLERDNTDKPNAYRLAGIGLGYHRRWQNGSISTLVLRYRKRRHNARNALLGATREDRQSSIHATLRLPQWQLYGFEPSISYEYRHNNSNVDWLYDYTASSAWFKMTRVF